MLFSQGASRESVLRVVDLLQPQVPGPRPRPLVWFLLLSFELGFQILNFHSVAFKEDAASTITAGSEHLFGFLRVADNVVLGSRGEFESSVSPV